jgi:hypothetical protein
MLDALGLFLRLIFEICYVMYFVICLKYQPEDDLYMVETCSCLTNNFFKVVYFTCLFCSNRNGIHKVKI